MPVDFGTVFDSKRDNEAEKSVKKCLDRVKFAAKIMETAKRLLKKPAITANLGTISRHIYTLDQMRQTDKLSMMPNELKYHVWSYLDDPADRLMLALTCKWNAEIFEGLKGDFLQSQPRSKGKASRKPVDPSKTRSKRKVNDAQEDQEAPATKKTCQVRPLPNSPSNLIPILQRLQGYLPTKYRPCYHCLRFRPKTAQAVCPVSSERGYWLTGNGTQYKPGKLTPKEVNSITNHGTRCPECRLREILKTRETSKEYKELRRFVEEYVKL